jgi:protoheme IX farnesyltransferase
LLIAWGGVVRATGSGDGCPDWPKCFGSYMPRLEYHTLIEYLHRLLGFASGLLALALAVLGIIALMRKDTDQVPRSVAWLAILLAPMFLLQGILGGVVVISELDPAWVTVHFAVAFLVLAIAAVIATLMRFPGGEGRRSYRRLTAWTAAATYALLLVGTYVRAEGAGLAFRDWPLMGGSILPDFGQQGAFEMFVHRLLAIVVASLFVWCLVRARSMSPRSDRLVQLATSALVLLGIQVIVGGASVLSQLSTWARATHVALSALTWLNVVILAVVARREPAAAEEVDRDREVAPARNANLADTVSAYVGLTKPRVVVLLLIITVPAMVLAAGAIPSGWLILATLVGGALAAGSANAMNMYLDRDIDQVMRRTRRRPIPRHTLEPDDALRFGFVLAACSFTFLAITVNVLAASLTLSAIAFYVFVYTMWLKRSTDQNIVIGGAAGAVPVLVGWAAVTGGLAWPAFVLFAVVFVWTPPHFWALALRMRDDYAAAGVPMLPVVRGEDETRRQIFLYSLLLFATTLVLVPVAGMGLVYVAAAVCLGGAFVYRCLRLWRHPTADGSWRVFRFSMLYLATLFAAVALDALA